jgi:uncharacterized damage-inducible protein DinB
VRHSRRLLLMIAAAVSFAAPEALRAQGFTTPMDTKGQITMWIKDAEDKLVQLAEATPAAKYSWRPAKDVRSTAEVFMHVASANFGMPSFVGVKAPEGFDFMSYEKSLTKKEDVHKALKESFAHLHAGLAGLSDEDLMKPAEIPFIGMKTNVQGVYMLLLSHAHEHLGQSIAYARSNNVTPPWTAKQNEAMRARAAKGKAEKK